MLRFLLLFFLSNLQLLLAAQADKIKTDSLERVLQTATDTEIRLACYEGLSSELAYMDRAKAKRYTAAYLALANETNNAHHQAQSNLNFARIFTWQNMSDSSRIFAEKVLNIVERQGSKDLDIFEGKACNILGMVAEKSGQLDRALGFYRRAEQKARDEGERMSVVNNIAVIFAQQNRKAEALESFTKVRTYALNSGDKISQAKSLRNIAEIYFGMGEYEKALEFYQNAYRLNEELGNENGKMFCMIGIGSVYEFTDMPKAIEQFDLLLKKSTESKNDFFITIALTKLAFAYAALDLDKALGYGLRAFERVKGLPAEHRDKIVVLRALGDIYLLKKEYPKALNLMQQVVKGMEKSERIEDDNYVKALRSLAQIQLLMGETTASWQTMLRRDSISDILDLARVREEIAKSEVQFRVKENEFALEQSKQTNQLQAEKAAVQRNLYLSLLGGAGLFLLFGFFAFRRSQHDRKLITEQKILLEQSLGEKEILLREIHHRVKNNLQIISGLLEKQARKTSDEAARKLLKEGQDRVFSMALVHQNLYQSDNLSAIEIKSYLEALTKNIGDAQTTPDKNIEVSLDVDDSTLDIDTAIPIALILNELITNCFKYAFSGRISGMINVAFHQKAGDFFLQVRDNGVGLAQDFDILKSKSLGLNLVRGLVRQLEGQLDYNSSAEGAVFNIRFASA